jgi:protein arginine kinase
MIDLSLLPDGGVGWLDASGESPDIVISTRVRLARNLEGYAFSGRARDGERLRVLAQVREAMSGIRSLDEGVLVRVDELPPEDRLLLHERHLVSRELAGLDAQRPVRSGAAVHLTRGTSVMVNEEGSSPPAVPVSQDFRSRMHSPSSSSWMLISAKEFLMRITKSSVF